MLKLCCYVCVESYHKSMWKWHLIVSMKHVVEFHSVAVTV
jgi:hypothetical protein